MGALVYQRNNLVLISVKPGQNFSLVYIIMAIVISFLMEQKSLCLMPKKKKKVNFLTQFCLGSICNGFGASDSKKVSLKENAYSFSVDYHWLFWHIKHSQVFHG